jgi:hypothetical protein
MKLLFLIRSVTFRLSFRNYLYVLRFKSVKNSKLHLLKIVLCWQEYNTVTIISIDLHNRMQLNIRKSGHASAVGCSVTPTDASSLEALQHKFASLCFCRFSLMSLIRIYTYDSGNTRLHSLCNRTSQFFSFRFIVTLNPALRLRKIDVIVFVSLLAAMSDFSVLSVRSCSVRLRTWRCG